MFRYSVVLTAVLALMSACNRTDVDTPAQLKTQFGTTANDYALGVAKYYGGIYAVGTTEGNLHGTQKGNGDAFIRKVDARGTLIWGKQFGTAKKDRAVAVTTDARDNAYVLGQTAGTLARALRGPSDFFLRKYTPSGKVAWTLQFGLDTDDVPGGVAVSGNSVYVVGTSKTIGMFIYRFNLKTGDTWWKKQFGAPTNAPYATGDIAIAADGKGNIYMAGETEVPGGFDPFTFSDVKVSKYNASGVFQWSKFIDVYEIDSVQALTAQNNSVYLAMNVYHAADDDSAARLVKLDGGGAVKWTRDLGPASSYDLRLYNSTTVAADSSGVYLGTTTSYYRSDDDSVTYSASKLGTDGSPVWTIGVVGSYEPSGGEPIYGSLSGIVAGDKGDIYIAGAVGYDSTNTDALLKRLSVSTGGTVWVR